MNDIHEQLSAIRAQDQSNISKYNEKAISIEELQTLQESNLKTFMGIVDQYGFPFKNIAPYETYKQAVTLALHTSPEVLQKVAKMFEGISDPAIVDLEHKAYFIDKLRLMEGKPQVYGTQFTRNPDKTVAFKDIENPDKVDQLRQGLGMSTLEEYKDFAEGK